MMALSSGWDSVQSEGEMPQLHHEQRHVGATSWETQLVSPAARWPQVADWGRQEDEAGTAEKAPQQHAKDGSMAKLDR